MQETKEFLLSWLPSAAELDSNLTPSRGKASATPLFPEVDFYISLLVLINLIDKQQGEQAVVNPRGKGQPKGAAVPKQE